MNFCGVICEFNPFHNGHEYLINQAKKLTGDEIICLMSGNFVQRGEPAIQEKYIRAKNAINAGASLVLELPTIFACSNAENFAYGAVKIFKSLNITHLAFGIENANLETLEKIAEIKLNNSITFQNCFKNEIENGINYNTALKRAISKEFNDEKIINILSKPNNILAIEYLTAIKKLNAKITPITIERIDNGYNSNNAKNQYLSASGIREKLLNNEDVSSFIPRYAKIEKYFDNKNKYGYENIINYMLRTSSTSYLEKCYDYNEGIEFRIKSIAEKYSNYDELISNISTPRYRIPRIKKLVLYPLLNITKTIVNDAKSTKAFAKVLAIKKDKKEILSIFSKRNIYLIITNKDYDNLSKKQKNIAEIDLKASNVYNTIIQNQNNNDKKIGVLFV